MIPSQASCDQTWAAVRQAVDETVAALEQAVSTRLATDPSLDAVESVVAASLQTIGQQVVTGVARWAAARPQPDPVCATCARPLRRVGVRPRTILGVFGPYALTRPYGVCAAGHGGVAPADGAWGVGSTRLSPRLTAIDLPFDAVGAVVAATLGVTVDGETIRRAVEAVGQVAEAADQAAAAAPVPPPAAAAPAGLVIAVDGAMVHTEGAWHEAKVGVCHPLGRTGPTTVAPHGAPDYCVGLESRAAFWPRLYAHAVAAGVTHRTCQVITLIGDGAHWIWDDGATYFGEAERELVEILDFYHAAEHLTVVAHAVWGEGTPTAQAWLATQRAALQAAGPAPLFAALAALPPLPAAAQAVVTRETGYFTYHRARMQYPAYRARGLPIGSGRVEGACQGILKQRLSQAGMRWRRPGAQAVATLRALHRSRRWDTLWARGLPSTAA